MKNLFTALLCIGTSISVMTSNAQAGQGNVWLMTTSNIQSISSNITTATCKEIILGRLSNTAYEVPDVNGAVQLTGNIMIYPNQLIFNNIHEVMTNSQSLGCSGNTGNTGNKIYLFTAWIKPFSAKAPLSTAAPGVYLFNETTRTGQFIIDGFCQANVQQKYQWPMYG